MAAVGNPAPSLPTSDERLMAALSHFFGLIVALIVWATQKDKSRFVRFQSLQAVAFDVLFMLLWALFFGCYFAFMAVSMVAMMVLGVSATSDPSSLEWLFLFPSLFPLMMVCVVPFFFLFFLARIIAAAQTLQGKDFRYPWLAERVEKFME